MNLFGSVKCNLLRFCWLVFSPFAIFFSYVCMSRSEFESLYDRINHCLSISFNHCVFSFFYLKVTENPERKLGISAWLSVKCDFHHDSFDLQFSALFLCTTNYSTTQSSSSALLKSLFYFYNVHGECLPVNHFYVIAFDKVFNLQLYFLVLLKFLSLFSLGAKYIFLGNLKCWSSWNY